MAGPHEPQPDPTAAPAPMPPPPVPAGAAARGRAEAMAVVDAAVDTLDAYLNAAELFIYNVDHGPCPRDHRQILLRSR